MWDEGAQGWQRRCDGREGQQRTFSASPTVTGTVLATATCTDAHVKTRTQNSRRPLPLPSAWPSSMMRAAGMWKVVRVMGDRARWGSSRRMTRGSRLSKRTCKRTDARCVGV